MDNTTPPPLISIILVSWNSAQHLPRCLESLAQQSFKDFEIVIVDNGSTDNGVAKNSSRWAGSTPTTFHILRMWT